MGTAYYLAPELVQREPYDTKVDIWSAGVIIYYLITGEFPFNGKTN